LLAACSTAVPPDVIALRPTDQLITPETNAEEAVGGLIVETDTDLRPDGGETNINVRRPYDVYAEDGHLVRHVDNEGAQNGEKPVVAKIPPGRYVVASVIGTTYRRVAVLVRTNSVTRVKEDDLRNARAVFGEPKSLFAWR
jgi:hypothetical protein